MQDWLTAKVQGYIPNIEKEKFTLSRDHSQLCVTPAWWASLHPADQEQVRLTLFSLQLSNHALAALEESLAVVGSLTLSIPRANQLSVIRFAAHCLSEDMGLNPLQATFCRHPKYFLPEHRFQIGLLLMMHMAHCRSRCIRQSWCHVVPPESMTGCITRSQINSMMNESKPVKVTFSFFRHCLQLLLITCCNPGVLWCRQASLHLLGLPAGLHNSPFIKHVSASSSSIACAQITFAVRKLIRITSIW